MEKNVIFFWFEFKKEKNNFSAINYIISLINYILNAKSLFKQKNINSLLALLIASFFDKKIISFPFVNEIIEYLQNMVIPIINLIINNSEGQGEPITIYNDNQGNNDDINENANDLANEKNNQEAIPPALANQDNQNQLNEEYH